MRNPLKLGGLIGDILNAGVRIILLVAVVQVVLVVAAICVGTFVWFNHGLLSGFLAGVVTFLIGQSVAVLILEMTLYIPEGSRDGRVDAADKDALEALRAELESTAEQAVAPNRPLTRTLNSTSSVRGSEDI